MDHPRGAGFGPDLVGLPDHLGGGAVLADVGRVDAGPQMAASDILRGPPRQQLGEALLGLALGPVELRGEVIGHALTDPLPGIGVEHLVLIHALDAFGKARFPDTEGADAELHPGLFAMHRGIHRPHQAVDVLAPPVRSTQLAAGALVGAPTAVVGKRHGRPQGRFVGIRVEIVVDVDPIEVVAMDHVGHHLEGLVTRLGEAGIEPEELAIGHHQIGSSAADVLAGDR